MSEIQRNIPPTEHQIISALTEYLEEIIKKAPVLVKDSPVYDRHMEFPLTRLYVEKSRSGEIDSEGNITITFQIATDQDALDDYSVKYYDQKSAESSIYTILDSKHSKGLTRVMESFSGYKNITFSADPHSSPEDVDIYVSGDKTLDGQGYWGLAVFSKEGSLSEGMDFAIEPDLPESVFHRVSIHEMGHSIFNKFHPHDATLTSETKQTLVFLDNIKPLTIMAYGKDRPFEDRLNLTRTNNIGFLDKMVSDYQIAMGKKNEYIEPEEFAKQYYQEHKEELLIRESTGAKYAEAIPRGTSKEVAEKVMEVINKINDNPFLRNEKYLNLTNPHNAKDILKEANFIDSEKPENIMGKLCTNPNLLSHINSVLDSAICDNSQVEIDMGRFREIMYTFNSDRQLDGDELEAVAILSKQSGISAKLIWEDDYSQGTNAKLKYDGGTILTNIAK